MAAQAFRPGDIVRARSESWIVLRCTPGSQAILEVRGHSRDNRGTRTSFLLPCEPIERLPASDAPRVIGTRAWRRAARTLLAAATPSYDALRSPTHASLTVLPFQLEPAIAVVRGHSTRLLIADEVGLGKTVQAGLIISELLARNSATRALVICPAGLRDQWHDELHTRFAIDVAVLDASSVARRAAEWSINPWSANGIVVTSLDYVKRPEVVRSLESLIWDVIVFDEAHALSGRSDRATAAAALAQRARSVVLLSATPHSGDDEAFARLTTIGDLSNRFPLLVFRRTRHDVGLASSRKTTSLRIRPTLAELTMHGALTAYARSVWSQSGASSSGARLAMTVLTRRACSSASSLGRSVATRLRLLRSTERPDVLQMALPFTTDVSDDGELTMELSSPGLADPDEECRVLEQLLQLARLAALDESKLRALSRLLRRAREPAIVFTEYRDTLERLVQYLHEFAPVQLHGGLTANERHNTIHQFVNGSARLLLATDAASEGLNLHQTCRLVINLELPWTPVRLEQRIGRVERLGQTRRVHAVHLLAADTREERSVAVLLARIERVADALGRMRGAPSEEHVADVVIGGAREDDVLVRLKADPTPESHTFPGVLVAHLRAAGRDEATRIETARSLRSGADEVSIGGRPLVTMSRARGAAPQSLWAFRMVFEDANQLPVWETVIGIASDGRARPLSNDGLRQWMQSSVILFDEVLTKTSKVLLASTSACIRDSMSIFVLREEAITEVLHARRARLAATLLQRGLFDRRAERAAAAQSATLDEALERCASRREDLSRVHHLLADRPRLVLGLVRR